MREWPRELFIEIQTGVRIRYCRSEPPPPLRYAVMLEIEEDRGWTTIRLWDNADRPEEHHEHGYTRQVGKQRPVVAEFESVNEAMATAIREARLRWSQILEEWRGE